MNASRNDGRTGPGGVDQGGVDPGGVDPGGVDPGGVDQGRVDQGRVDQGRVDQGDPTGQSVSTYPHPARGAPRPHHPSAWFVWGWRVATVLPVGFLAVGVWEWSSGQPQRYGLVGLVLAGLCLLAGVATIWVLAAGPRLTNSESQGLPHDLGRPEFRWLRRALLRRDPIPVDLRPWAAAYVWKHRSTAVGNGFVVAVLTTAALTGGPTDTVMDVLALVAYGVCLAGLVTILGLARWLHCSAEILDLPMEEIATRPARSDRSPA